MTLTATVPFDADTLSAPTKVTTTYHRPDSSITDEATATHLDGTLRAGFFRCRPVIFDSYPLITVNVGTGGREVKLAEVDANYRDESARSVMNRAQIVVHRYVFDRQPA